MADHFTDMRDRRFGGNLLAKAEYLAQWAKADSADRFVQDAFDRLTVAVKDDADAQQALRWIREALARVHDREVAAAADLRFYGQELADTGTGN